MAEKGNGGGCVTGDTLVTMADGSTKRIDEVTFEDELLVWDFYNGEYAVVPAAIISNHGYADRNVITLNFEDGTNVKVVELHQFFDADSNELVSIDAESVANYVGHSFVKRDGEGYKTVKLEDYNVEYKNTDSYGIVSALHYNILVDDMFSADYPYLVYDLMTYFEVGDNMVYDEEKMNADVATYGLYTYDEFAEYMTCEEFDAMNIQYMKISVGKGYYTYEGILELIERWLAGYDDVVPSGEDEEYLGDDETDGEGGNVIDGGDVDPGVAPLSDEGEPEVIVSEPKTLTITLDGNSIAAANYAVSVSGNGIEATEDGYLVKAAECDVILTADGTATTGYAKISVGDDVYYTNQIAKGESFTLTMKNAVGKAVSVESFWGNSANYGIAQDTLIESGKVNEYTYTVEITATNATEREDGYLVGDNESVFNLKAVGTATMGYAVIAVDGDAYYTQKIVPDEEFRVTVKNGKGKTVEITSFCGEFDYGTVSEEYILGNDDIIDCGTFVVKSVEGTAVILANTTKYAFETVDIYVAVYDSQNRMVAVKSESNVSVAGKDEHTFDSKLTIPENGYAKVFVWSGNGAFKPFFSAR